MKKSLTAIALMGVFAGANAADVTLYGIIDYGMYMNHTEVKTAAQDVNYDTVELNSGINAGPLFGLIGEEDLGNGYKVSFKLENGFNADDGTLNEGRLFNREAAVTVSSGWGSLAFGRMGGVGSSYGTYDLTFAIGDSFDGGDSAIFGMVTSYRRDNMVTYQSPKVAGLQATVQYSFKMDNVDGEGREGHSDADRYAGFALTGDFGKLQTVVSYEQDMLATGTERDDAKIVSLGGNYSFDMFTLYAMGQYFEGANRFLPTNVEKGYGDYMFVANGQAFHLGAASVLPNGYLQGALYYMDAEEDQTKADYEYMGATVRYTHNLSQRTSLYVGVGYSETDGDFEAKESQAYFGMTHSF